MTIRINLHSLPGAAPVYLGAALAVRDSLLVLIHTLRPAYFCFVVAIWNCFESLRAARPSGAILATLCASLLVGALFSLIEWWLAPEVRSARRRLLSHFYEQDALRPRRRPVTLATRSARPTPFQPLVS